MVRYKTGKWHKNGAKFFMLIFLFIALSSLESPAQKSREETPPLRERIFYGGSFGLQLGTITNIEFLPVIGIWVLPRIAVAAGPGYRFYKLGSDRTDILSARSYVQFVLLRDIDKFIPLGMHTSIFLHAEDELMSLDSEYWKNVALKPSRFYVNTLLAGAGISQQIGRRSSLNLTVLWELSESEYNIYGNPEFRISFVF